MNYDAVVAEGIAALDDIRVSAYVQITANQIQIARVVGHVTRAGRIGSVGTVADVAVRAGHHEIGVRTSLSQREVSAQEADVDRGIPEDCHPIWPATDYN